MNIKTRTSLPKKASQSGFSLISALMAMAIIGILFASLYNGVIYGFSSMQMEREALRATQIATEKMETIRLYTWEQITSSTFIPKTFEETYYPDGATNAQGVVFYGTLTITNALVSANYSNQMKMVTVELNWTTGKVSRKRSLTTLVGANGLQNYVY